MGAFFDFCKSIPKPIPILGKGIDTYTAIDLGSGNMELSNFNIGDYTECQRYIDTVLERNRAEVAHGGYLEKRKLYDDILNFGAIGQTRRNIHLGIDFWSEAGTEVLAPLKGWVHSYRNNRSSGDYGPTIILGHKIGSLTFYTLYGHLSVSSLKGLYEGKKDRQRPRIGRIGYAQGKRELCAPSPLSGHPRFGGLQRRLSGGLLFRGCGILCKKLSRPQSNTGYRGIKPR